MSKISAKVIKDSISEKGKRLTTLQLKYHRYIHGEFNTHRAFSRNASSSRAIPVRTMLKQVLFSPAIPMKWMANKPGMQADSNLTGFKKFMCRVVWRMSAVSSVISAGLLCLFGLHKQWANRILEPYQYIDVLVSSTDWDNFMELRFHPDAQPEMYELAWQINNALNSSKPKLLKEFDYHLPYISKKELKELPLDTLIKCSTARCARVSYLTHDKKDPSVDKDVKLYERLVGSRPLHASPAEHIAEPDPKNTYPNHHGNFDGWIQHRKVLETTL